MGGDVYWGGREAPEHPSFVMTPTLKMSQPRFAIPFVRACSTVTQEGMVYTEELVPSALKLTVASKFVEYKNAPLLP
jgi:hypothetical protein